jgi:hypothetical protein
LAKTEEAVETVAERETLAEKMMTLLSVLVSKMLKLPESASLV